jgi:hypothetical protein
VRPSVTCNGIVILSITAAANEARFCPTLRTPRAHILPSPYHPEAVPYVTDWPYSEHDDRHKQAPAGAQRESAAGADQERSWEQHMRRLWCTESRMGLIQCQSRWPQLPHTLPHPPRKADFSSSASSCVYDARLCTEPSAPTSRRSNR